MAWQFQKVPYTDESFADMLVEAVDALYCDPKDRLAELKQIHEFFGDGSRIGEHLWREIRRRLRELKLCEFCGYAVVWIDGEDYCTKCDQAEVERLLEEKRMREAV